MRSMILFCAASLTLAAGGIEAPTIGFARAADGTVVRVSGVSGAFDTTATEHQNAVAAAFSGKLGIVKFDASIRTVDRAGQLTGESDAPAGDALIGFNPAGDAAIVWYAGAQSLAIFQYGAWQPLSIDPQSFAGTVLSVALNEAGDLLAVVARDQLVLVAMRLQDGAIESETILGTGGAPALVTSTGEVILTRDGSTIYHDAGGNEQILDVASPVDSITRMGASWIQLHPSGGGNSLALRLTPDLRIYQIPEVAQ